MVGLGAVGQQVARLGAALGMTVLGMRRTAGPVPFVSEVLGPDRLAELCARADALILCLPQTPSTRGLIGANELADLGAGWLVNVGRGSAVDESALLHALRRGPCEARRWMSSIRSRPRGIVSCGPNRACC